MKNVSTPGDIPDSLQPELTSRAIGHNLQHEMENSMSVTSSNASGFENLIRSRILDNNNHNNNIRHLKELKDNLNELNRQKHNLKHDLRKVDTLIENTVRDLNRSKLVLSDHQEHEMENYTLGKSKGYEMLEWVGVAGDNPDSEIRDLHRQKIQDDYLESEWRDFSKAREIGRSLSFIVSDFSRSMEIEGKQYDSFRLFCRSMEIEGKQYDSFRLFCRSMDWVEKLLPKNWNFNIAHENSIWSGMLGDNLQHEPTSSVSASLGKVEVTEKPETKISDPVRDLGDDTFQSSACKASVKNVFSTLKNYVRVHGHLELVSLLNHSMCNVDSCDQNSRRLIHFACRFGHPEIVRHLCEKGCDKEALTDRGERPIHIACIHDHLEIVRLLCEQKCDIEALTPDNYRPIHLACQYDHVAIVEYLCQQKCNIEALAMFDYRPIHVAVLNGHIDIVRYLCQQRCEIEAVTKMGKSVLDLAMEKGCHDIHKFLSDEIVKRKLIEKISNMKIKCLVSCDHSTCFKSIYSTESMSGRGGFGCVFKIHDRGLNYTYCIKSIYLNQNTTNQKDKHIESNIDKYLHVLHHERVVQYFGMMNLDKEMIVFMEYVEGTSLDKHINERSLPHNKIIQYSKEILEGLKFLHENKIIHRDIKPQNIMLNTEEHVKLCDFGLSCYLESIGKRSQIQTGDSWKKMTFCGTPNYMAPELILGQDYSYPVDIWGLGASVVEMLTGQRPFHMMEDIAIIFHIGNIQKIDFIPTEPMLDEMKSFVDEMLCPRPSTRATAEMLLERTNVLLAKKIY